MLHAMGFSATMWYATVSGLSSEFRCYAADFPSDMGLSAMTCPPASLADCAAWLSALLDCLGIVRSALVGASYGSFLALNYAIAEPARVSKVLLTSPAAGFVALRKSFFLKLFLSILTFLLPGRSAPEKMMRWIFEDRLPLDHPVIRQMMVGIRSLNSRIRVYPKVFGDSELAKMQAPLYLLLGEKEVCYNPQSAAQPGAPDGGQCLSRNRAECRTHAGDGAARDRESRHCGILAGLNGPAHAQLHERIA